MSETLLDLRGLLCPIPVLRARKAMRRLPVGALVRIRATDPGTVRDFQALCEATGDELLEHREEGGEFVFLIRRAG